MVSVVEFKLVLLGDTGVGKSSVVLRFVKGEFDEEMEPTIGAAFLSQTVNIDNWAVKFQIWDTAGQERYYSLAPMYYRGASAAVIVYDVTQPETFDRAKDWVEEIRSKGSPDAVLALAGNKCDRHNARLVNYETASQYAMENDLIFFETSAKTNLNIKEIFYEIAKKLPKKSDVKDGGPLKLKDFDEPEKKEKMLLKKKKNV